MRILLISSYLPYPLFSGGNIRLFNLMKHLSTKHQITLICEKRDNQTQSDIEEVEKICEKVITVKRQKQWSAKNIIKTGFSFDPFLITGHTNEQMRLLIQDELVRNQYDLIHVETFYVYQNIPSTKIPIVLVEHNVEYMVYQRFAYLASPLVKPLLLLDVAKLKRKEEAIWSKVDKLVAVSNVEKRLMRRDVDVVPNGVDTGVYGFRDFLNLPKEKYVLFIGDYKWMQNKDSVEFILKEIWPNLREKYKQEGKEFDLKLWIVGKNMPHFFKRFADETVILDYDNKDTTTDIFRKAYILLAPLRAAGGTSYKILESMSTGTAVVTTGLGTEGLEAKNGIHVLSSDSPHELSNFVYDLANDHSLYKKITLNARKFIEQNYDWKIISEKLNLVYEQTI